MIARANARYGVPSSEKEDYALWTLDSGVSYEACMSHYEGDMIDLTEMFTQRYYSPDESPR